MIDACQKEQKEIAENSSILSVLKEQLGQVQQQIIEQEQKAARHHSELGRVTQQIEDSQRMHQQMDELIAKIEATEREQFFPRLEAFRLEKIGSKKITLDHIEKNQSELRGVLQNQIDGIDKKIARLGPDILQSMHQFKTTYPLETTEIDANIEAIHEYQTILNNLEQEDLPRHEARFKAFLNEGTINSIALLQNQLNKERCDIQDKIAQINKSLMDIEYNVGTYITLVMDQNQDVDIREFQQDLLTCLSDTITQNELYTGA